MSARLDPAGTLRLLVAASLSLHFLWLGLPLVDRSTTREMEEALRWSGYGGVPFFQHWAFHTAMAVAKTVAMLGILLFRPWGRWSFLALLVVSIATLPFGGISVGVPKDAVIGGLLGLLDGAILALAFVVRGAEPRADS